MLKTFKRVLLLTLSLLMVAGLVACAPKAKTEEFIGTQAGYGGDVTVTLQVKDGKIESLTAKGDKETESIGKIAIVDMNEALAGYVGKTVADIDPSSMDVVSTATVTSNAVVGALKKAVKLANGDTSEKAPLNDATAVFEAPGNSVAQLVSVEVTIKDNAIAGIEVIDSDEVDEVTGQSGSNDIFQSAVDNLIPRILESQSLAVDSISGATNSSNAIKLAVAQAIDAAGGDSSEWYTEIEKSTETVKLEGYDVIVVGLGGSGMSAYISAAENGATVFGIETAAKIGGQSATVSGPMAINPELKMALENNGEKFLEEEDLIADWIEYCLGDAKEDIVREFVEQSGETMDWLMTDYDFKFEEVKAFFHPKMWEVWAYYEGNKTVMFTNAVEKAKELNEKNDYMLELTATELIMDGADVAGVKAVSYDGTTYEVYGSSVILATGGFIGNSEMKEKYLGEDYSAESVTTQNGDGIRMGLAIGAGTYNIDMAPMVHIAQIKNIIKNHDLTADQKAVLSSLALAGDNMKVGTNGSRFMNEAGNVAFDAWMAGDTFYAIYTQAQMDSFKETGLAVASAPMFMQQGGKVEAGVPVTDLDEILEVGTKYKNVYKAETLEELAGLLGIDKDNLVASAQAYTSTANGEAEDVFGKDTDLISSLEEGPYYAVLGAGYSYGTCGGLDIDVNMNVLKTDGTPIANLYAIGQDSMGVLFSNQVPYVSYGGAAQGWVLTSGRLAGANAAENFKK